MQPTSFDQRVFNILGLKGKRITLQSTSRFRLCSVQRSVAEETPQGSTSLAPFPVKRKIKWKVSKHKNMGEVSYAEKQ